MNLKAALLSGLVLPGLGQLRQKKFKRAVIFIASFLGIVAILMSKVSTILSEIEAELSQGTTFITTQKMIQITQAKLSEVSGESFSFLTYLTLFIWLAAVIDAAFLKKVKETPHNSQKESLERIKFYRDQIKLEEEKISDDL